MYGPTDLHLYPGVYKLIISFNLKAFLADLASLRGPFLNVAILLGSDPYTQTPTNGSAYSACVASLFPASHPLFPTNGPRSRRPFDLLKYYKTSHAAICTFDHPTMKTGGRGRPIASAMSGGSSSCSGIILRFGPQRRPSPAPKTMIFTHRLPDECVFFWAYLASSPPHSLLCLTTGVITEYPLDNGENTG